MRHLSAVMAEILGANIVTLRKRLGMSQAVFGEQFEVSQGTVSRWENGGGIEPEHLFALARRAGCSPEDLTLRVLGERPAQVRPQSSEHYVLLPVALPNVEALTAMFEGFLEALQGEADRRKLAGSLAELLPDGLAQSVSYQPEGRPTEGPQKLRFVESKAAD